MSYKYTNQELFDKVTEALVAQGEPSIRNGRCVYFGTNKKRCAAGHLVPDEFLNEVKEHHQSAAWNILVNEIDVLKEIGEADLILKLQIAHDTANADALRSSDNWRLSWVFRMGEVASDFNLSAEKLSKLATEEWQKGGSK